jgi:S1-C subfamily serine protease
MNKRFAITLVVLVLFLSTLACQFSPQAFFSAPVAEPTQQTVTVVSSAVAEEEGDLPGLYSAVNPGVVAIRALTEEGGGLGTGFVWDSQGHIVTNYHVVGH